MRNIVVGYFDCREVVVLGLVAAWREGVQLSALATEGLAITEGDVETARPTPIVLGED